MLLDEEGRTLIQPEQPSQRLERHLTAGSYQLGVVTVGTRGEALRYQVIAERQGEAAPATASRSATGSTRIGGGVAARRAWAPHDDTPSAPGFVVCRRAVRFPGRAPVPRGPPTEG